MDEDAVLAALNDTYKLNSKRSIQLFEDADAKASLEELELEGFLDYARSEAISNEEMEPLVDKLINTLNDANLDEYREYIDKLSSEGISYISILDSEYPSQLKEIEKPPLALYVNGDLGAHQGGVAIVGTRSATDRRIQFAHRIAKRVVKHDRAVISGLANGIDEAGHKSAVSNGGKTIGVLPGHINKIYPQENRSLAEEIPDNGALVSEVSENVPLNRHRFVERNRITSGLSEAVIIGASKETGGTVRQAEFAETQDVPILLYDPPEEDGQSPEAIKEKGVHSFADLEELDHLLSNLSELRVPNGGNKTIDDYVV